MTRAESENEGGLPHRGHADPNIAHHIQWPYSVRAFLWNDRAKKRRKAYPCGINFRPLATQLRLWLLRKGQISYVKHHRDGRGPLTITNPYTESGSILALMYSDAINEAHTFATSAIHMDDMDAEIRRTRYYSEIALLNARISEAFIKQLLYCTAISTRDYKKVALRGLLERECRACEKAGKPHKISLLGSLAHRFHLCHQVESCLGQHLEIAIRRRNTEASHATVAGYDPKPVAEVRARLNREVTELGEELVHLLQHIGQIEKRMTQELEYALSVGIRHQWWRSV